jgi:mannose-6-phosphate isomerase-like protein (cupin superfamily)
MRAMLRVVAFLLAVFTLDAGGVHAQSAAAGTAAMQATDISAADIQAHLQRAPQTLVNGRPNIRVVDAGGYNVAIGVLHRAQNVAGVAAKHYKVTEVYHVMDGAATLVTGGRLVNAKVRPADSVAVTQEDGPGESGTAIEGGVSRRIKAGDVVVIPAGTPHWFSAIDGSISYLVVRFDPDRILTLK